jgi:hypothetical protein
VTFDLAVLSAQRRLGLDEARSIYRALCAGERPWDDLHAADARVGGFFAALTAAWPDLGDLDDASADSSPWAANLDRSPGHVIASITWTAAEEMEVTFCSLAMRHGLYAYNPQSDALYDPTVEADREMWLAADRESRAKRALATAQGPWKAKGGKALADEVVLALVAERLPPLRLLSTDNIQEFAFPVNDDVEGRLDLFPWGPGRHFEVRADVGVVHAALEAAYRALSGAQGSLAHISRRLVSQRRLSWKFDADELDWEKLDDLFSSLEAGMGWAASLSDLEKMLAWMLSRKDSRSELMPVALGLAGRLDEAAARTERLAARVFGGGWAAPDLPGAPPHYPSHEMVRRDKAYIARLHDRFDPSYRRQAAPLVGELRRAGLPVEAVSELYDAGVGDERAVPVLLGCLSSVPSAALERDVLALLGAPWAKPTAALPLAQEFLRVSGSGIGAEQTLLAAAAESFFQVADESAFEVCTSMAADRRLGLSRAPFVSSLGNMPGERERALPVLLQVLAEPSMAEFALPAIAELDLTEALPAVERLASDPKAPWHTLAIRTSERLRHVR